jgi:hypothetical protein
VAMHGGSRMVAQRCSGGGGRRKNPSRGRAPFIEGRGGGRRAARRQNRSGETVAGSRGCGSRWRPQLGMIGAVRTRSICGSDRAADGWAQRFYFFLKLSKLTQTWKLKMDTLQYSQNSQIFHADRLGHYEQLSQL